MSTGGRYAGLFPPPSSSAVPESSPYGKFGRQKSTSGSLVNGGDSGERSDCGDSTLSSPLTVNGAAAAASLMGGSAAVGSSSLFGYDVDDVGLYRRSRDDAAAFRPPHIGYSFPHAASAHHSDPSSFVLRQPDAHQPAFQQQPPQPNIFYGGHGSALPDAHAAAAKEPSPVDSRARRYFSPAAGYLAGGPAGPGSVMPATYGTAESRYDGALGSLNSYLQRGAAFTTPGMASALHHLARSLPVFR